MEAETETVHSSVSAWAFVITGSHLEVCDVSSTEAEEATNEKGTIRLRFRRSSAINSSTTREIKVLLKIF